VAGEQVAQPDLAGHQPAGTTAVTWHGFFNADRGKRLLPMGAGADSLFAFRGFFFCTPLEWDSWSASTRLSIFVFSALLARADSRLPKILSGDVDRFWINAITGTILLAVNATKLTHNTDFYVKLAFIVLAVINVQMLRTQVFGASIVSDTAPDAIDAIDPRENSCVRH